MAHPIRLGIKRKRLCADDPRRADVSLFSSEEIDAECERLRKKRAEIVQKRPDVVRRDDFTTVTHKDAVRSLTRKSQTLRWSAGAAETSGHSRVHGWGETTIEDVGEDSSEAAHTTKSSDGNAVADVDLETLQTTQKAERRDAAASKLATRLVESLLQFEALDRVVSHWMMTRLPGCDNSSDHLSKLLRFLITEHVALCIFNSSAGQRDELYLFGAESGFHIPFSILATDSKLILALMIKKQSLLFQRAEHRSRGVCGYMHTRFVFDEQFRVAVSDKQLRQKLLNHALLTTLAYANERQQIRGATSMLLTMASDICGMCIEAVDVRHQDYSKQERTENEDVRAALHVVFAVLLDPRALSLQLCAFQEAAYKARANRFRPLIAHNMTAQNKRDRLRLVQSSAL